VNAKTGAVATRGTTEQEFADDADASMVKDGFTERELKHVIKRFGNVATVLSSYEGTLASGKVITRGVNIFQLILMGSAGGFSRWFGMRSARIIPSLRSYSKDLPFADIASITRAFERASPRHFYDTRRILSEGDVIVVRILSPCMQAYPHVSSHH
jgi:hypothetical protein